MENITKAIIKSNIEIAKYIKNSLKEDDFTYTKQIGFGGDNSLKIDIFFEDIFIKNQEKRIKQIEILIEFLISKNIIRNISEEEIKMISKVSWFISAYWQTYISTNRELSKNSIKEAKDLIFKLHLEPLLVN